MALHDKIRDEIELCLAWRLSASAITKQIMALLPKLTVAVRACGRCKVLLGVAEWRGDDAHPGEDWLVTHGLCDTCLAQWEAECDAQEARA